MNSRSDIITRLVKPGIIAVVRTKQPDQVLPICHALVEGGVLALEITLTVPNALQLIREVRAEITPSAIVGVGSVLNASACQSALEAGAEFAVSPITVTEIIPVAHKEDRPVILGAYTPTEAQTAHLAGADFIKIFPADRLGPPYIKGLLAPLPHLKIVPTGGVDLQTASGFLKAGCAALGVGSSLITRKILGENDWPELTRLARAYVEIVQAHAAL